MAATTAAVVGGVASAASAANSIANSGGGGSPKWQRRNQKRISSDAMGMTQQVAGFSPDQLAAMQGVRDMQGRYDGDYASAQARADQLAGGVTQDDIRQFYNPFENDAVSAYLNDLQAMRGRQDVAVNDAARAAGAFGGDREAVYRAVMQGEMDRTGATTLANMRMQGYGNAVNAALSNMGYRQAGNAQLANLIGQRQLAGYQDINALNASGLLQQQLQQRQFDAPLDTLRFRTEINNPGSYARPESSGGDPIAAALHGFQGGMQGVQGAIDAWNALRTPAPVNNGRNDVWTDADMG